LRTIRSTTSVLEQEEISSITKKENRTLIT
jgi:hypothetical protein